MDKILYNTFFAPGKRFYKAKTAPGGFAAVHYPGKPIWLWVDENISSAADACSFFSDFLDFLKNRTENVTKLVTSPQTLVLLGESYKFAKRREIAALFNPLPFTACRVPIVKKFETHHAHLVSDWLSAFYSEALHTNLTDAQTMARSLIASGKLYGLFDSDKNPLAMGMVIPLAENMSRLNLIYVPLAGRGKGYARRLVPELCVLLHEQNILPVLYVYTDNTAAMNLYNSTGFLEAGRLLEIEFQNKPLV